MSVKVVRIKVASHLAALNQPAISLEILKRQHALVKRRKAEAQHAGGARKSPIMLAAISACITARPPILQTSCPVILSMPEGFERRPRRQVLQPGNLIAQVLVLGLQGSTSHFGLLELVPQLGHLRLKCSKPLRQIDNEPAQGVGRQRLRSIVRKRAHAVLNQTSATGATSMPGNLPRLVTGADFRATDLHTTGQS
ncbi:hypothetical protein [Paracoccus actinidiae]|uniref:hypothetical protein n=1 Tax=Paracoccus actinidiae TaxID=3064531 RepID=UPI00359C67C3